MVNLDSFKLSNRLVGGVLLPPLSIQDEGYNSDHVRIPLQARNRIQASGRVTGPEEPIILRDKKGLFTTRLTIPYGIYG